jgi:hypothetical protein
MIYLSYKGEKKMKTETKLIKQYLKSVGLSHISVRHFPITQASMPTQRIYYSYYNVSPKENKVFKDYYKKVLKQNIKISMNTYGILHEIGHCLSFGKDYNMFNFAKAHANYERNAKKIARAMNLENITKYRQLKMERLADKYAYALYLLHEKEAIELDKQLQEKCG